MIDIPTSRDLTLIKQIIPLTGAVLERLESNYQKPISSRTILETSALLPVYFAVGIPELTIATARYTLQGLKSGKW